MEYAEEFPDETFYVDGSVERVGTAGSLLGPFAQWRGTTAEVNLGPGDLMLCYTDGLTEARRGHEEFGEQRLMKTLSQFATLGPEALVKSLEADVTAYAGELSDDLAMLAIRREGRRPANRSSDD